MEAGFDGVGTVTGDLMDCDKNAAVALETCASLFSTHSRTQKISLKGKMIVYLLTR